jgi:hypothetical protein
MAQYHIYTVHASDAVWELELEVRGYTAAAEMFITAGRSRMEIPRP